MKRISARYLLISILPVLILILMSITPIATNKIGQDIKIKGKLFYNSWGEYSYIEYDINNISMEKYKDIKEDDINKIIYVVLKQDNDYYDVDYVSLEKPQKHTAYLKGKISYFIYDNKRTKPTSFYVMYTLNQNIDNIKVDEGIRNEAIMNNSKEETVDISAHIKVYNGYSKLWRIY